MALPHGMTHPRQREHFYPTPPREPIQDWPAVFDRFIELLNARPVPRDYDTAFRYARDQGCYVRPSDVPAEFREQAKAHVRQHCNPVIWDCFHNDAGESWR
ncbi:hypothetical protein WMF20_04980 [Sorangium sp. So ce834]|uniref:hypothetical protein n=1 Tax=Sorangium sp. So ce834 TaxID=3133321 RepID=UPI003F6381DA